MHMCCIQTTEKRVVHGERSLLLNKTPVPLFAISPNHGKVEYRWEMKRFLSPDWAPIDLPKWTCLLFVDEVGKYRCNFESTAIVFEVEHSPQVKHSKSNG